MDEVSSFIEDSSKWRDQRHREMAQARENQANELAKLQENLHVLADESKKSRETIEKNLNSIMSHKHSIHRAQDSASETGLPISNTYHGEFVNFITNTMSFINEVGENKYNPEKSIDEAELSISVQTCNENIMKRIHKDNEIVDEVQTIMENIDTVKDYYTAIMEEGSPSNNDLLVSDCLYISE